jgi:parvulin-like peptidyl-prolyl isomerase
MTLVSRIKSTSTTARVRMAAMMIVIAAGGSAMAQQVAVFVNGDPITAIDVEQRAKLIQLTEQKAFPRQQVLDQLIDEKLKVREESDGASRPAIRRSTAASPPWQAGCRSLPTR